MTQSMFSVRMDENLKRQFDALCVEFGMNMSTAINIFARAVVREKKIPFEIASVSREITHDSALNAFEELRMQALAGPARDMSMEEIDAEIHRVRYGK